MCCPNNCLCLHFTIYRRLQQCWPACKSSWPPQISGIFHPIGLKFGRLAIKLQNIHTRKISAKSVQWLSRYSKLKLWSLLKGSNATWLLENQTSYEGGWGVYGFPLASRWHPDGHVLSTDIRGKLEAVPGEQHHLDPQDFEFWRQNQVYSCLYWLHHTSVILVQSCLFLFSAWKNKYVQEWRKSVIYITFD